MARILRIKAFPDSRKDRIEESDGKIRIFTREPAQDNRANDRILELLAEYLSIPRSHLRIIAGHRALGKTIEVREQE